MNCFTTGLPWLYRALQANLNDITPDFIASMPSDAAGWHLQEIYNAYTNHTPFELANLKLWSFDYGGDYKPFFHKLMQWQKEGLTIQIHRDILHDTTITRVLPQLLKFALAEQGDTEKPVTTFLQQCTGWEDFIQSSYESVYRIQAHLQLQQVLPGHMPQDPPSLTYDTLAEYQVLGYEDEKIDDILQDRRIFLLLEKALYQPIAIWQKIIGDQQQRLIQFLRHKRAPGVTQKGHDALAAYAQLMDFPITGLNESCTLALLQPIDDLQDILLSHLCRKFPEQVEMLLLNPDEDTRTCVARNLLHLPAFYQKRYVPYVLEPLLDQPNPVYPYWFQQAVAECKANAKALGSTSRDQNALFYSMLQQHLQSTVPEPAPLGLTNLDLG